MDKSLAAVGLFFLLQAGCGSPPTYRIGGDLRLWHPFHLTIPGPEASEKDTPNPFLDIRMEVEFRHESGTSVKVPGFFAADGQAADSGAAVGSQWKAFFTPPLPGKWEFTVSLKTAPGIALSEFPESGKSCHNDGLRGTVTVTLPGPSDPNDPRDRGKLKYAGARYLQFSATHDYFIKAGADSPENLLAFHEFDGVSEEDTAETTRAGEARKTPPHRFEPHLKDWRPGDPSWRDGLGKGIIGALNYLASRKVNSVYFLTMNVAGDGNDVWPYTTRQERYRFDCSKLDQWERVFAHMDRLGIQLHVVLTETENESLFEVEEGGEFANSRRMYYREMIARFAHHSSLVWNLGEENGWTEGSLDASPPFGRANTDAQRKAFAEWIRQIDPYDNPIVVHTLPGRYDEIYEPLLGFGSLEGPSLQIGDIAQTHSETLKWVNRSAASGRPWFVCLDEIGPADTGVKPDSHDPWHDEVRRLGLWANLMAGGAGCEWYFGYNYPHNDLGLEDFRSRDRMWEMTAVATEFFRNHLPFAEMQPSDELVAEGSAYCLAKAGETYAVYLLSGGRVELLLPDGRFTVQWFDPRQGGSLQNGSLSEIEGPGPASLGTPLYDADQDWMVLVRRLGAAATDIAQGERPPAI